MRGRKGEYEALLDDLAKQGFARARVDGEVVELSERAAVNLARYEQHTIEVVVDRLVRRDDIRQRLTESMETALRLADGIAEIGVIGEDGTEELLTFSEHLACTYCDLSFEEPAPRNFSFNSPYGACPACDGLGTQFEVDPELVVPDPTKTLADGALAPWAGGRSRWFDRMLEAVADEHGFSTNTRWDKLRKAGPQGRPLRLGRQAGPAAVPQPLRPPALLRDALRGGRALAAAPPPRVGLRGACGSGPRPSCARCPARRAAGPGSSPSPWPSPWAAATSTSCAACPSRAASAEVDALELTEREHLIADRVLREVQARLRFLLDVGLDYLSLARGTATLSGGEAQRIRLASQIGSGLVGVLYVLDEPSIGLHQRDNRRLLDTLVRLRDLGNTVIVVEHDEETIRAADHVVDIGPGAGEHGGEVVYSGDGAGPARRAEASVTGQLPDRGAVHPRARQAPPGLGRAAGGARGAGAQPPGHRRRLPPRVPGGGHRGVGIGQVDPRERHPAAVAAGARCTGPGPRRASTRPSTG